MIYRSRREANDGGCEFAPKLTDSLNHVRDDHVTSPGPSSSERVCCLIALLCLRDGQRLTRRLLAVSLRGWFRR